MKESSQRIFNQFKILGDVYYSGGIRGIDPGDPILATSEKLWMLKIDQSLPYFPGKIFIDIAGSPSFTHPAYGVLGVALGPFIIPLFQQWDNDPYPKNIDWVCVSPKASTKLLVTKGDELKLVFPQEGVNPNNFIGLDFTHFFLQPLDDANLTKNSQMAVEYCMSHSKWRLSTQTHKILKIP